MAPNGGRRTGRAPFQISGVSRPTWRAYAAPVKASARERARDRIEDVARHGHDLATLWREASEVLRPVVPHYLGACYYTLDPASLLITSHFNESMPELPPEWVAMEYYEDDINKLVDIAQSPRGWSTLHEATGGDPSGSPRWQANIGYGGDQELIAALRTPAGEAWGAIGLYREPGAPVFDDDEIGLVVDVAPTLAAAARRGLLVGEATDPEGLDAPGLLVLSDDWELESSTPGTARWLADFPDGDWETGDLPS